MVRACNLYRKSSSDTAGRYVPRGLRVYQAPVRRRTAMSVKR